MATAWGRDRGTAFYLAMGCVALAAALAGFSTTYFFAVARGGFGGTLVAHVHGWLFFGWVALIVVAMLRDRIMFGRVHPAYWIFGSLLILDHLIEVLYFDAPVWRTVAKSIYGALG